MGSSASQACHPEIGKGFNRLVSIDALRGLAALAVLGYHARATLWIGLREAYILNGFSWDPGVLLGYLSAPFSFGGRGVTLFFVLSGYCIHRRGARYIASGRANEINWRSFFARRFWRIYPTYICALLLTACIDYWLWRTHGAVASGQDNSFSTFLFSLVSLQGYFAPSYGSNGVFWTLAMEIHLYAVYPLLFYISTRRGPRCVLFLTLGLSLSYSFLELALGFESLLVHRFSRGPIFIPYWFTWTLGFYIAEVQEGRALKWSNRNWAIATGLGFIIGIVLTKFQQDLLGEVFWAVAFGGVLHFSIKQKGEQIWRRIGGKQMAALGLISYSLYAIHSPLLNAYHAFIASGDLAVRFPTLWPAIGGMIVSTIFAFVFYRLVECWSIRKSSSVGVASSPSHTRHVHEKP